MKKEDLHGIWLFSASDTDSYFNNKIHFEYNHFEKKETINTFKNQTLVFYDIIIEILSKKLNKIHKTNFSLKFWNYLVGPWLFKFLEYYLDKYLIIKGCKLEKNIINYKYFYIKDFLDFYNFSQQHEYNAFIFNQIKAYLFEKEKSPNIIYPNSSSRQTNIKVKKKLSKSLKLKLKSLILKLKSEDKYKTDITNFNLVFNEKELFELSNKKRDLFNNLVSKFSKLEVSDFVVDKDTRNEKLDDNLKLDDEFLNLVNNCILLNLPASYLEAFKVINKFYSDQLKKIKINRILLRSSTEYNENYRFLIANLVENGTKVLAFQEGGIGKNLQQTEYVKYSKLFCDEFYIWSKKKTEGAKNLFCTKTFWIKKYKITGNKILIVLGSVKPYFFSLYESNFPNFGFHQTRIATKLIQGIDNLIGLNDVILRLHNDNGFGEMDYYSKKFTNLKIEDRKINPFFFHLLSKSKIKIFTSDYTANMQSYILNHPTIFLWDEKMHLPNPNFEDVYERMIENKMLFTNPEKCLRHLDEIKNNLNKWWFSEKVQKTRDYYLRNFCPIPENFKNEILDKVINKKT